SPVAGTGPSPRGRSNERAFAPRSPPYFDPRPVVRPAGAPRHPPGFGQGGRGPPAGRRGPALCRYDPLPAADEVARRHPLGARPRGGHSPGAGGKAAAPDLDLGGRPPGALLRLRLRAPCGPPVRRGGRPLHLAVLRPRRPEPVRDPQGEG